MKKIIALALVLTMVFSMALTVSAADETPDFVGESLANLPENSVDVVITIDGVHIVHKYAFDIEYGSMEFIYGESLEWDPVEYKYVSSGNAGDWSAATAHANEITVINHSDLPIYCSAEGKVTDTTNGNFTLTVSDGAEIAACGITTVRGSLFHTMTVTLEGAPYISYAKQQTIGSVVVTISQPATNDTTVEESTENAQ